MSPYKPHPKATNKCEAVISNNNFTLGAEEQSSREIVEPTDLPPDWTSLPIAKMIKESNAGDWGKSEPDSGLEECYVLRGTDFYKASAGNFSDVPVRYIKQNSVKKRKLRMDDLLVELSGGSDKQPTGRILHVSRRLLGNIEKPIIYSNFVKRLCVEAGVIEPEFFSRYWFWLYENGKTRIYQKRTTGIWNFKLADFLENERIAFPPLPEQKAVCSVLRTVQQAKEACERVIAATRQLKQSLLQYLFTYGPVPFDQADKVPLKETEIGLIPEHWRIQKLKEVGAIRYGLGQPPKILEPGLPMIRATNIKRGRIVREGLIFVAAEDIPRNKNPFLREGDVLVVRSGAYTGDVAAIEEIWEGSVAGYDLIVTPTQKILSKLLEQWLLGGTAQRYFRSQRDRSAQPHLNSQQLGETLIPIIPLDEQKEMVNNLLIIEGKLAAEEARRDALIRLFQSLLHHLMTGKVRVTA